MNATPGMSFEALWRYSAKTALEEGNIDEFLRNDREFHNKLVEYANNKTLEQLIQLIRTRIMLGQVTSAYRAHRRRESLNEHQRILEAILAGDAEAAESAMRYHIKNLTASIACNGCQDYDNCPYRQRKDFNPQKCTQCRFYGKYSAPEEGNATTLDTDKQE